MNKITTTDFSNPKTKSISAQCKPEVKCNLQHDDNANLMLKKCKICFNEIHFKAKICTHCDSYQNPIRRLLKFSNTFLSLLIALFAVLAVLSPQLNKLLKGFNSEFVISFHDVNNKGLHFLIVNKGGKPGVILESVLNVNDYQCIIPLKPITNDETGVVIIDGGCTKLVSFQADLSNFDRVKCQDNQKDNLMFYLNSENNDVSFKFSGIIYVSNFNPKKGKVKYDFSETKNRKKLDGIHRLLKESIK